MSSPQPFLQAVAGGYWLSQCEIIHIKGVAPKVIVIAMISRWLSKSTLKILYSWVNKTSEIDFTANASDRLQNIVSLFILSILQHTPCSYHTRYLLGSYHISVIHCTPVWEAAGKKIWLTLNSKTRTKLKVQTQVILVCDVRNNRFVLLFWFPISKTLKIPLACFMEHTNTTGSKPALQKTCVLFLFFFSSWQFWKKSNGAS